ncbi:MAG: beta-lactamase family protein [Flavobacteriaceae bacterium]|nr:beta-lactamase family protein [Flavobacteriaceae bacterium]
MINTTRIIVRILAHLALLLFFGSAFGQTSESISNMVGKPVAKDSLTAMVNAAMEQLKVAGISMAVINDAKVVYHYHGGYADLENKVPVNQETLFEAASLSKPMFAFFVMDYVEKGLLDLDKPLYEYLPYQDIAHDERYKKITARMVLSHTTGFPNWRTDYGKKELFIQFDPGSAFFYSGEGYQYLAKVLMRLSDTDDAGLEALFQKRFGKPLQLKHTRFVHQPHMLNNKAKGYAALKPKSGNDDINVFGAAFSVHSEALDFSKWLIALLKEEHLSASSFERLFETQVVLPEGHEQRQMGVTDWTLGFAKAALPIGTAYGHGGNNFGYTSLFVVVPDSDWGLIIFTNDDQSQLPMAILQHLMQP